MENSGSKKFTPPYSFAVRNAVNELKDAANFITRSNEVDTVLKKIIKILSLQQNC